MFPLLKTRWTGAIQRKYVAFLYMPYACTTNGRMELLWRVVPRALYERARRSLGGLQHRVEMH